MAYPEWVDKLPEAVSQSRCYRDVLRYLNKPYMGSGYTNEVKKWIEILKLDISHFNHKLVTSNKVKLTLRQRQSKEYYSPENMFVVNPPVLSLKAIKRLAKQHIEYKCECGNVGEWLGKKLSLQLDHKNGNRNDNRKENLRWMCPNCHTQTETWSGKNRIDDDWNVKKIVNPNWRHLPRIKTRKVIRPSKEKLALLIEKIGNWKELGRTFGVSDNAVRKWAKAYQINEK